MSAEALTGITGDLLSQNIEFVTIVTGSADHGAEAVGAFLDKLAVKGNAGLRQVLANPSAWEETLQAFGEVCPSQEADLARLLAATDIIGPFCSYLAKQTVDRFSVIPRIGEGGLDYERNMFGYAGMIAASMFSQGVVFGFVTAEIAPDRVWREQSLEFQFGYMLSRVSRTTEAEGIIEAVRSSGVIERLTGRTQIASEYRSALVTNLITELDLPRFANHLHGIN